MGKSLIIKGITFLNPIQIIGYYESKGLDISKKYANTWRDVQIRKIRTCIIPDKSVINVTGFVFYNLSETPIMCYAMSRSIEDINSVKTQKAFDEKINLIKVYSIKPGRNILNLPHIFTIDQNKIQLGFSFNSLEDTTLPSSPLTYEEGISNYREIFYDYKDNASSIKTYSIVSNFDILLD